MGNGSIECRVCDSTINWITLQSEHILSGRVPEAQEIPDDKSVISNDGYVRCKKCGNFTKAK